MIYDKECETMFGRRIKTLRSDGGGEYTGGDFVKYLESRGIKHQVTAPRSSPQNGVAERKNRTLCEAARATLRDAGLPKKLWAEAVSTACYCQNRAPTKALPDQKTPHEVWNDRKPNISHLRVFGCDAYALKDGAGKLDEKAGKFVHVGYIEHRKGYKLYDRETEMICFRRDVVFHEESTGTEEIETHDLETSNADQSESGEKTETRRSGRSIKPPTRYGYDEFAETVHYATIGCDGPRTYDEAMNGPERDKWKQACDEEYQSLIDNDTWKCVPLPPGRSLIDGKWVFTRKVGEDGKVSRYKARYVAKGFTQEPGVDYTETFAPTARLTSVRMLMQYCVDNDMSVIQMDVTSAYLNSPIDCELYVAQPQGYEQGEGLVCRLKRSLYGLKQSGRNWNSVISNHLITEGFTQSHVDYCLFTKGEGNSRIVILLWVDDILMVSNNENVMSKTRENLIATFQMKDLGEMNWFLGIHFVRQKGCIMMSQKQLVERLLESQGMNDCKPRKLPLDPGILKADLNGKPLKGSQVTQFRSIIGSLIHLMSCTRPDLSFCVTFLSQFMKDPNESNLLVAKDVLRYLKGTAEISLVFTKATDVFLNGYSDSDWGSLPDRKSVTGYCFKLNLDGSFVAWKTRKQSTVALSTCEAEYVALSCSIQEAQFLEQLYFDITGCDLCVVLHVDNQAAISLARNPVDHKRSKHIDVRYHHARNYVMNDHVELLYAPTDLNLADPFTKPVSHVSKLKFVIGHGASH